MTSFVHLHVHTDFSYHDGTSTIAELISAAQDHQMNALAITDHDNMHGIVKFYDEAVKNGIKPIIGCEISVTAQDDPRCVETYHLTLLAENNLGLKNLICLTSDVYGSGCRVGKRVVSKIRLKEHAAGLIALSGCASGEVQSLILNRGYEEARAAVKWYRRTFGENNYFLEIMHHGYSDKDKILSLLPEISKEMSIPLVATCNVHYAYSGGAFVRDIIYCRDRQLTLDDIEMSDPVLDLKPSEQVIELFSGFPEAVRNTVKIAERCNCELPHGDFVMPSDGIVGDLSPDEFLEKLAKNGLKDKYPCAGKEVTDRLNQEMNIIKQTKYAGYFLLLWDIVEFARKHGIPCGPGRGSVSGSIVAYLIGVTMIDPMRYGLIFERFLNPDAPESPYVALDVCSERREEIVQYLLEKYGDSIARIASFKQMTAKDAIRSVLLAAGEDKEAVDAIANEIPAYCCSTGKKTTVDDILEAVGEKLKSPHYLILLFNAHILEQLVWKVDINPAGFALSKQNLSEIIPVFTTSDDEGNAVRTTQVDRQDLERLGIGTIDILGLKALSETERSLTSIAKEKGKRIDLNSIPLDDPAVYDIFCEGGTDGIFQFSGRGIKEMLIQAQPRTFEELMAISAMNRQGMEGVFKKYVLNKSNPERNFLPHPCLEPILSETYGVLLYQEQIIRIASVVAGFTTSEAESFRRALLGRHSLDVDSFKDQLVAHAMKHGFNKTTVQSILQILCREPIPFLKAHCASYTLITYRQTWLMRYNTCNAR